VSLLFAFELVRIVEKFEDIIDRVASGWSLKEVIVVQIPSPSVLPGQ
jgi:hypothetical protein